MRVIVRPSGAPNLHIDVTRAITSAIAHELERVQEGNDILNWLEAERILSDLMGRRSEAEAGPVTPAGNVPEEQLSAPRARRAVRSSRLAASSLPARGAGDTPRAVPAALE